MEAALLFGYTPREWAEEEVRYKAQALAHMVERNLREAWTREQASAKTEKPKPEHPYEAMKRAWLK